MKKNFVLLLAIISASCSGIKVLNTETGDAVNFTRYKTFNFYEVNASGDTISQNFNNHISLLKEAINYELDKRGFTLSKTNPDLLVNIGIVVKDTVQTRETDIRFDGPRYIGQRNYSWKSETVEMGRYREGTVTLDLVDAAQKKLVWKGSVQGILPSKETAVLKTAQKGMELLFDKFPVGVTR